MSFLDLLGTVEGARTATAHPQSVPGRARNDPASVKAATAVKRDPLQTKSIPTSRSTTPGVGQTNGGSTLKRKADSEIDPHRAKTQRADPTPVRDNIAAKSNGVPTAQPYRGTAGLAKNTPVGKPAQTLVKPPSAVSLQTSIKPAAAKPVTVPPTKAATGLARPPPKKGSYAEILARAATTQSTSIGIKHKTIEEIKKDKVKAPPPEKTKPDPMRGTTNGGRRPGSADVRSGSEKDKAKIDKARKPPTPGYQGTARAVPAPAPSRPAYKGTMGLKRPDLERKLSGVDRRGNGRGPSRRDEYYDDDEEDVDDEEDYDSEGSSDMEANIFDVDREEEEALRTAKREDASEQAKLEQLEREKKRKKQLAVAQAVRERKERRRFM